MCGTHLSIAVVGRFCSTHFRSSSYMYAPYKRVLIKIKLTASIEVSGCFKESDLLLTERILTVSKKTNNITNIK